MRVAIDERTGQALVLAPPAVQEQIRSELAPGQPPAASSTTANAAPAAAAPAVPAAKPSSDAFVRLQYVKPNELKDRLERLLARPLAAGHDASGQWQSFKLEVAAGAAVTAAVNLTTGEVRLDGPANLTSAWRQVIEAIDTAPSSSGAVTQLVSTNPASQDRVHRALTVLENQNPPPGHDAQSQVTRLFQPRNPADTTGQLAQADQPTPRGPRPSTQPARTPRPPPTRSRSPRRPAACSGRCRSNTSRAST